MICSKSADMELTRILPEITVERFREQVQNVDKGRDAMQNPEITRRGLMLVLSSPSGAGKTTISRRILASDDNIDASVSVMTRSPVRERWTAWTTISWTVRPWKP